MSLGLLNKTFSTSFKVGKGSTLKITDIPFVHFLPSIFIFLGTFPNYSQKLNFPNVSFRDISCKINFVEKVTTEPTLPIIPSKVGKLGNKRHYIHNF